MTIQNGYFPGKKRAKRSNIITPRTAQDTMIAAMPKKPRTTSKTKTATKATREELARLGVQMTGPMKAARIYLRVSTDDQDLQRQEGVCRDKAIFRS